MLLSFPFVCIKTAYIHLQKFNGLSILNTQENMNLCCFKSITLPWYLTKYNLVIMKSKDLSSFNRYSKKLKILKYISWPQIYLKNDMECLIFVHDPYKNKASNICKSRALFMLFYKFVSCLSLAIYCNLFNSQKNFTTPNVQL